MGDAGFIFWGLLVILGLIPVGYVAWMRWAERRFEDPPAREDGPAREDPPAREHPPVEGEP